LVDRKKTFLTGNGTLEVRKNVQTKSWPYATFSVGDSATLGEDEVVVQSIFKLQDGTSKYVVENDGIQIVSRDELVSPSPSDMQSGAMTIFETCVDAINAHPSSIVGNIQSTRCYETEYMTYEEMESVYGDAAVSIWEASASTAFYASAAVLRTKLDSIIERASLLHREAAAEVDRLRAEMASHAAEMRASGLEVLGGDESAWIDDAMNALSNKSPAAMERLIWWVFSKAGCTGKSTIFGQRLFCEKGAFLMPVVAVNPKTGAAILQKGTSLLAFYSAAISVAVEKGVLDATNPILVFDFPRSVGGLSVNDVLLPNGFYTVCEQLKTGSFFDAKYSGKLSSVGRAPFVIVTANGPPPLTDADISRCGAISYDRVEALQISANLKQVGAHTATKTRLEQLGKRTQQDDDSQADFHSKGFGFDPDTLHGKHAFTPISPPALGGESLPSGGEDESGGTSSSRSPALAPPVCSKATTETQKLYEAQYLACGSKKTYELVEFVIEDGVEYAVHLKFGSSRHFKVGVASHLAGTTKLSKRLGSCRA
tara:strand:- start:35 stop:1654 length:1620 start_codon:yes stop_codon:yes gene_type:complete